LKTSIIRIVAVVMACIASTLAFAPAASAQQVVNFVVNYDGKCLDIPNGSTSNQAQAQQYTCNGGSNQKWIMYQDSPTGYAIIVNVNSGKCLDVVDGSGAVGAKIQQYTCRSTANQLWNYDSSSGLLRVAHSGLCAAVRGGSVSNKEPVVQQYCTLTPAYQWTTTPAG
jgi:ricin-type beta-trefoil lectin protein